MNLRVLDIVEAEVVEAASWYNDRSCKLGTEFLLAYRQALSKIEREPSRFPRLETLVSTDRDIRRVLLKRFPYYVVYEVFPNETVVLAVAHGSQRPNYWQDRAIERPS